MYHNFFYDPRIYPRSNRYLVGGCLRPLGEVLLNNERRRLKARLITAMPLRGEFKARWRPWYEQEVERNGHQRRRREQLLQASLIARKAEISLDKKNKLVV